MQSQLVELKTKATRAAEIAAQLSQDVASEPKVIPEVVLRSEPTMDQTLTWISNLQAAEGGVQLFTDHAARLCQEAVDLEREIKEFAKANKLTAPD
jgi:hypothetical protein